MFGRLAPLLLVATVLAGCGGGSGGTQARATCTSPAARRALTRLNRDVAALKRAAAKPAKNTLLGNVATNAATDRFLNDVATAPVSNLIRNRMIDHAAAALVGSCEQCFQALEANRPIPAIAQGEDQSCQGETTTSSG